MRIDYNEAVTSLPLGSFGSHFEPPSFATAAAELDSIADAAVHGSAGIGRRFPSRADAAMLGMLHDDAWILSPLGDRVTFRRHLPHE